jgi:hypothetical protein
MEEDMQGIMRTLPTPPLAVCARCGGMTSVGATHLVQGDTLESGAGYEQLCDDCYRALLAGERDLAALEP